MLMGFSARGVFSGWGTSRGFNEHTCCANGEHVKIHAPLRLSELTTHSLLDTNVRTEQPIVLRGVDTINGSNAPPFPLCGILFCVPELSRHSGAAGYRKVSQ